MLVKLLLISCVCVAIAFIALGFNIFFRKGKKFPETEVGKNKNMKDLDIRCVKCDEMRKFKEIKKKKIDPKKLRLYHDT